MKQPEARIRMLVAAAALTVVIAYLIGAGGLWTSQPFPVSR